ncbi:DUF1700 domain-containing protein [Faecalicatena contorta]|uniref:DUF1700 domain-containing protein n=1 Tax=Faecalicatena contorta TaxID=39482 RepID=UPI001F32D941|nr:DUF1700 domain-containing protein [Faecalicatena contorta]MCF2555866.1 DUF1700 domain-containing protein [Faecalicatena contorta]
MTKSEFLEKLRAALANDLSGSVIQENVNYYSSYISDEVRKGRNEAEVIAELGDPWVIAQTIIDSSSINGNAGTYDSYSYEPEKNTQNSRQSGGPRVYSFGLNTWWQKLLLVLGIVGVVMIVIAVVSGIVSLFAPLILPVLIIVVVFRLLNRRR